MNAPIRPPVAPVVVEHDAPDLLLTTLRREHGFEPLRVEGEIPPALNGSLYRVGPGVYEAQGKRYEHMFEGDGAVCGVRIGGGRAEGAHRVVRTRGLLAERDAGRPLFGSVAPWPRRVLNGLTMKMKNAANTNLLLWQDQLFALWEPGLPTKLTFDLETEGERDLGGVVPTAFSAHYHRVVARNAIYNFGVRYGATTYIDLFELPDQGRARRLASIPIPKPVMLHDFIATERHLVFFVSPALIRWGRVMLGLPGFDRMIGWDPDVGTEVIVVPIDDPDAVTRFTVDSFYQWHFANAFEARGEIVVDLVRYDNLDTFSELSDGVRHLEGGKLWRARIDVARSRLHQEQLDDRASEFPRIDPRFEGCAHDRVWLWQGNTISQHDLASGYVVEHAFSASEYASEPVFVPRHERAPEGDGWVLSLVYDRARGASYVAILDTARFEDKPVAKLWFDHHIPMTFHGVWTER